MAYNKGLNLVTGTGRQTIDALKNRAFMAAVDIAELGDAVDTLGRPWLFNEVTLTETSNQIKMAIPDGTEEIYAFISTAQQESTINGSVRVNDSNIVNITGVIHASHSQKASFHIVKLCDIDDGFYFYLERANATNDPYSTTQSILTPASTTKFGDVGIVCNSGTFSVGDSIIFIYR